MEQTRNWKADLDRILDAAINDGTGDVIAEITGLAKEMGEDVAEALLAAHPELYDRSAELTRRFREIVAGRDIAEVQRLMHTEIEASTSFRQVATAQSVGLYDRLDELHEYLDLRDCQQVVMVGCGRRPFTVFHFRDKTDIPEIVGLDIRAEEVDVARQLAAHLGYSRVRFEVEDGCGYDYSQAQVIYVSSMVTPKSAVVTRIADTAPQSVQIVLWEPVSLGRLWAESVERNLDPRLEGVVRAKRSSNLARDIVLRRRGA